MSCDTGAIYLRQSLVLSNGYFVLLNYIYINRIWQPVTEVDSLPRRHVLVACGFNIWPSTHRLERLFTSKWHAYCSLQQLRKTAPGCPSGIHSFVFCFGGIIPHRSWEYCYSNHAEILMRDVVNVWWVCLNDAVYVRLSGSRWNICKEPLGCCMRKKEGDDPAVVVIVQLTGIYELWSCRWLCTDTLKISFSVTAVSLSTDNKQLKYVVQKLLFLLFTFRSWYTKNAILTLKLHCFQYLWAIGSNFLLHRLQKGFQW